VGAQVGRRARVEEAHPLPLSPAQRTVELQYIGVVVDADHTRGLRLPLELDDVTQLPIDAESIVEVTRVLDGKRGAAATSNRTSQKRPRR
jgi:hypothetical protein